MRPLKTAAIGILLVAIDINVGSFDLLFDPLGYVLVLLGVHRLVDRHAGFRWARIAAAVGLVASVFTALLRRTVTTSDEGGGGMTFSSTQVVDPEWSTGIEMIAQAGFVIGVCTALIALSRTERVRSAARTLRVALPVTDAVLLGGAWLVQLAIVQGVEPSGVAGAAGLLLIPLAILAVVLAIWFFITLVRASREAPFRLDEPTDMIPG